ncbi:hypothetical protein Tco_0819205 [Tanacetum coccineum]|uniref:Uncharacterized protein n=1 Tax=Tanacetum coccineum TaxID=301880 RepID=A0ABQ5AA79_9ASTR
MLSWVFTTRINTVSGSTKRTLDRSHVMKFTQRLLSSAVKALKLTRKADFPYLNQNDIEDLYLLKIQNKIHNINGVDEFDLINSLQLYIQRILIKNIVEDKVLYTTLSHPRGIVYEGTDNKKRLMKTDEIDVCIDVIDEILEEDFDALLNEGSKILHTIEGTPLEDKIFSMFDEFIAMNIKENTAPKNNEEIPFEKITFDTDYKIKKSLEEPPTDLELKPLPDHLEYTFLEEPIFLFVISS